MLVDPDGRDIYVFDENGNYSKTIQQKGEHVGRILGGKDRNDIDFKFADPVNDPVSIDKGAITSVSIMSDKSVNAALFNSGVFDKKNQRNKYSYIVNNSNINMNEGKMDYLATANFNDGKGFGGINEGTLYIVKTKSGYTGHNAYNFGNFLWGAGASALGFDEITARVGAHVNNYFTANENQGKPYYTRPTDPNYQNNRRSFDSKDDQFSISTGFQWMRERRR